MLTFGNDEANRPHAGHDANPVAPCAVGAAGEPLGVAEDGVVDEFATDVAGDNTGNDDGDHGNSTEKEGGRSQLSSDTTFFLIISRK